MKLHQLSVSAFGPFAGTETVDFDALNDAGLFLLAGPTGAGKTSILDAVCFALYGTVPGVRGVKTLKSQHADDETAPEVLLEFSVRERRFRIRRSPEWSRPKRRGSGTVTEKAAASLTEVFPGDEHFLTARAAEVGLLVSDLIGMRAAQFQQVAMLPQGEFQRFLHATTQERHDVLQQLFQTDRFARIEEWVSDHSRDLRDRAQSGETGVRQLLHTIAERAGAELPAALGEDASPAALTSEAVLTWPIGLLETARAERAAALADRHEADAECSTARDSLESVRRTAELVRRRDEARSRLADLATTGGAVQAATNALDADTRATACVPLLELMDRAGLELAARSRDREAALTPLAEAVLPGDDAPILDAGATDDSTTSAQLEAAELRAHRLRTRVVGLLPRVALLHSTAALLTTTTRDLALAETSTERLEQRRRSLPDELEQAQLACKATGDLAARHDALSLEVAASDTCARAAAALPSVRREAASLEDAVRDHRDDAADARDVVQRLAERRLAGIAAELAGRLADGEACVVCGSCEHPDPAGAGPDLVTEAEQIAANEAYEAAQEALLAATRAATEAVNRLDALVLVADGRTQEVADDELARLRRELRACEEARARLEAEARRVADLEAETARVGSEAGELATTSATLRQQQAMQRDVVRSIEEEIASAVGDLAPDELSSLLEDIDRAIAGLGSARTVVAAHRRALEHARELEGQAAATVSGYGFSDVAEARAAALSPDHRARLQALLAERAELTAAARTVLSDPDIVVLGDAKAPDVTGEEAAASTTEVAAQEATRRFHLVDQRVDALDELVQRLTHAFGAWAPLRTEHLRADSMARLVRGMGTDNHLQMRLSAYVLATRLDQVLDAANERLSHMRDQRYLLQRTGRAARKGSQAGLGLEIVDQWAGDVREPATLSGGETFVVSLSLALGLADVVTQETGGTEIETLFVDEGFGTLDADTLDDVMDRLDGLRAGGRTVGVVSHVSELRTRIPAQLHVRKTPQGSSIRAETLVG